MLAVRAMSISLDYHYVPCGQNDMRLLLQKNYHKKIFKSLCICAQMYSDPLMCFTLCNNDDKSRNRIIILFKKSY